MNLVDRMKESFDADLFEFTGKHQVEYQKIREDFEKIHPEGLDAYCLRHTDLLDPKHKDLIKAYNDPIFNAFVFSYNGICPKSLPERNIDDLRNEFLFKQFSSRSKDLNQGMRLLEYGCGSCNHALAFWLLGFDLTLTDLPLDWLKFIEFRIKKYNIPRIKFIYIENNEDFLPKDEKYDCFFTHDVFEHVINPDRAMRHIAQHLERGALAYIELKFHGGGFHLQVSHDKFNLEEDRIGNEDGNQKWRDVLKECKLVPTPLNWNFPPYFFRKLWT